MMFKKLFIFSLFCTFAFFCAQKNSEAGVYFINKPTAVTGEKDSKPCLLMGYKVRPGDCKNGQVPTGKCPNGNYYKSCGCDKTNFPYNESNCSKDKLSGDSCGSTSFKECKCDVTKYKFTNQNCKDGMVPSGESCDGTNFTECKCITEYTYTSSNCPSPKVLTGKTCDGKYESCQCNSSLFPISKCNNGYVGDTCSDSRGTFYKECRPEECPAGTVDPATYFDGHLKYVIDITKNVQVVGAKNCITLPTCESLNFKASLNCSGQDILRCPFDTNKIYCHYGK